MSKQQKPDIQGNLQIAVALFATAGGALTFFNEQLRNMLQLSAPISIALAIACITTLIIIAFLARRPQHFAVAAIFLIVAFVAAGAFVQQLIPLVSAGPNDPYDAPSDSQGDDAY